MIILHRIVTPALSLFHCARNGTGRGPRTLQNHPDPPSCNIFSRRPSYQEHVHGNQLISPSGPCVTLRRNQHRNVPRNPPARTTVQRCFSGKWIKHQVFTLYEPMVADNARIELKMCVYRLLVLINKIPVLHQKMLIFSIRKLRKTVFH